MLGALCLVLCTLFPRHRADAILNSKPSAKHLRETPQSPQDGLRSTLVGQSRHAAALRRDGARRFVVFRAALRGLAALVFLSELFFSTSGVHLPALDTGGPRPCQTGTSAPPFRKLRSESRRRGRIGRIPTAGRSDAAVRQIVSRAVSADEVVDIFAVGDVWELLQRDMQGKAIFCRPRAGAKGFGGCLASSVMLLDCARLQHWRVREDFEALFRFERDYMDWICLKLEPRESLGLFEDYWNDFDRLTPETKLLHNTKRQTQPWKSGLPVDFTPAEKRLKITQPKSWVRFVKTDLLGLPAVPQRYKPHPDPRQEAFFFGLLRECLENGTVSEDFLRQEMAANHVRHDAFEVMERTTRKAA